MTERKRIDESGGKRESILSREFVEEILAIARDNLLQDGVLKPALFLQFEWDERTVYPLELPDTTAEKQAYFTALGMAIRKSGKKIYEAMTLMETWYLTQEHIDEGLNPSEHPARKEAISLMGRDRARQRSTLLLQPFHRDRHDHLIFEPVAIQQFNVPWQTGIQPVGVLDYLLSPPPSRKRKRRKR